MAEFDRKDFADWTRDDVVEAISSRIEEDLGSQEAFDENKLFTEDHDHWQDGDGWVGPTGTLATRTGVLADVEPQFTPVDVVSECVDRTADALLKQSADISFVLAEGSEDINEQQSEETDLVKRAVSKWWDDKKLWDHAKAAARRSRWAGRGIVRLWIARGNLTEILDASGNVTGWELPTGLTFAEALDRIDISAPMPDVSYVYKNPHTRQEAGLFHFVDDEGIETADIWYVDENKQTTFMRRGDSGDEEFTVDLKGSIPIAEMTAPILLTEPVRRQQRRLNFLESILNRVGETAGFAERYIANAEPHGTWLTTKPQGVIDPETTEYDGVTYYLHPQPRTLGASITTELFGVISNPETAEIAMPEVTFKDPTDPDFAIKGCRHAKRSIYEECRQIHVLLAGDPLASGKSREQARADFEADVTKMKNPLELMLRDTIQCAIAFASAMSNENSDFLEKYRVVMNVNINTGPITHEEIKQNNENVEKGTLSRESAMVANGVEDVDAELQKIMEQPTNMLGIRRRQMIVANLALQALPQLDAEGLALIIGVQEGEDLFDILETVMQKREEAIQAGLDKGVGGADLGDGSVPRLAEQRGASNTGKEVQEGEEEIEPAGIF
jgi:hypothetical protein